DPYRDYSYDSSRLLVVLIRIRVTAPLVINVVQNGSQQIAGFKILDGMLEQFARRLPRANNKQHLVRESSQDVAIGNRQHGRRVHDDVIELLLKLVEQGSGLR